MNMNAWDKAMLVVGTWILVAFAAACVHIARTDAHPDLGRYVLLGASGLIVFGALLYGRHRREKAVGFTHLAITRRRRKMLSFANARL